MRCEMCGEALDRERVIATNQGKLVCEGCMRALLAERKRRKEAKR